MGQENAFSVETGKKRFSDFLSLKVVYNDELKKIKGKLYYVQDQIDKADGLISQTVDELASAFFMGKKKKDRKYALIKSLKEEKSIYGKMVEKYDVQIRELKIDTFGADQTPKILFGKYIRKPGGEAEPIEWDVVRVSRGRALLLCENIIECMCYSDRLEDTSWKDSKIRKWANGEFYENAFSRDEKAIIQISENSNPGNATYKTADSVNTRDLVSIPSVNEVGRYHTFDSDRIARATPYAASKGIYIDEKTKGSYWWLRSNGGNMYNASVVNYEGYVFEYGVYVNNAEIGVRPAVWVNIC